MCVFVCVDTHNYNEQVKRKSKQNSDATDPSGIELKEVKSH